MSGPGTLKQLLLVIAAGFVPVLVVAACTIQLRGDGDNPPTRPPASRAADPLAGKLERCRAVTTEQPAELGECRRIWTENRRRFLGQREVRTVDGPLNSEMPSSAQPGVRSHLPEGSPSTATPNSE
ncbi:putative entry exclusion protein TrbK-alt [Bradyrhizobium murdochi]|uniref:putative entry exclusion protein TrbK-alt n=1 Tax=Bradyrhizobium murdochi TaxID=1038859 RepID=UPI000A0594D1